MQIIDLVEPHAGGLARALYGLDLIGLGQRWTRADLAASLGLAQLTHLDQDSLRTVDAVAAVDHLLTSHRLRQEAVQRLANWKRATAAPGTEAA